MIVVVDASVLVAELLRHRGRELFAHPNLRAVVAEDQWDEAEHEITKRLATIVGQGRLAVDQERLFTTPSMHSSKTAWSRSSPARVRHMEPIARRRVPRDPDDWPPVALALTLDVSILTSGHDFLGCGWPTWTVDTLRTELDSTDAPLTAVRRSIPRRLARLLRLPG